MATAHRFYVTYERTTETGTLVSGGTIVTAKLDNLSTAGAQQKLSARFKGSKISVVRVSPYLSGSDLVKKWRADREVRP